MGKNQYPLPNSYENQVTPMNDTVDNIEVKVYTLPYA